jgi:8-oxo-dGTP diphosphatase
MPVGRFSAGIGALLWRPSDSRYLVLKRSEAKDVGAGTWECISGRVDQGEGFTEAVHREVGEELGLQVQIDFVIGTEHFYRGEARPENELLLVQFCCSVQEPAEIELSWEHSEYRWVTALEAEELLPAGHWLGKVIRRAEVIRALLPAELLEYYRVQGLEL